MSNYRDQIHNALILLFSKHQIEIIKKNNVLVAPNGIIIDGIWENHTPNVMGVLHIEFTLPTGQQIKESFVGWGKDPHNLSDGFNKFLENSFHVFLTALFDHPDTNNDYISTEKWMIGNTQYSAFIGSIGLQNTGDQYPVIPENYLSNIAQLVEKNAPEHPMLWLRFYMANVNADNQVFESLLNNYSWDAGVNFIKQCSWEKPNYFYSTRIFIILKKL